MPDGGRITLSAAARSEEVEVEVADTGAGIPAPEVERVFEPLWRGGEARATRPRDGAGLGLPISRSIVEAHGGRIYVAEASSRGTQIRFTLPRLAPADADERAALRQPEAMDQQDAVTPGEGAGGSKRRPPDADENRVVASASLNDPRRLSELRAL